MPHDISVLMVCLGNICRSPMAEGVFQHLIQAEGLADRIRVDSAGTGRWHVGESLRVPLRYESSECRFVPQRDTE